MHAFVTGEAGFIETESPRQPVEQGSRDTVQDNTSYRRRQNEPDSHARQHGRFLRTPSPGRRPAPCGSGALLPAGDSAQPGPIETVPMSGSKGVRARFTKKAPWNDKPLFIPNGKRLQTLSKAELAALFGVSPSELGRLGHLGLFRRLGGDKYILDYRRSLFLLSQQRRQFMPRASRWGQRPAIHTTARGQDFKDRTLSQGLAEFYLLHGGLMESNVNILNVPDLQHATLAAGMFLAGGLQRNEQVAVVTFEHPDQLLPRLSEAGLNLDDALQTEQLIYLYYKPDVAHSLSLSVDYRELFKEVAQLGGEEAKRLVLFNVDALINTNSEHLVHTSLHQLIYAANHFKVTLLGLFVASGQEGELLNQGCRAVLPGYYVME